MKPFLTLKAISMLALSVLPIAGAEATPSNDSPSIHGFWRTQAGASVIELFSCGNRTCGRLVSIRTSPESGGRPLIDTKNRDLVKRSRPLCELAVLGNFKQDDDEWSRGWIYSPDSGSTYEGTLRLEDNDRLIVEGVTHAPVTNARIKWTREWTRAEATFVGCEDKKQLATSH